ncbi:MAG: class I SAM-dependent methyltransferase [Methylococcaceae bacterium]
MNTKIWTPRYAFNRIKLAFWEKTHNDDPWLTRDSINLLKSILKPSDVGLEWGSGRSTIWFAKKVKRLTSIETDKNWIESVKSRLISLKLNNVELIYAPEKESSEYIKKCINIHESSIDFALIDGSHSRELAAGVSIPLLKPGGLLIIDNINWYITSPFGTAPNSVKETRPEWRELEDLLKRWRCYWTTSGVTDTAIWFKP